MDVACPPRNVLVLKIQPDEGISFRINIKVPGSANRLALVDMDFSYMRTYGVELPEAYERLLMDCLIGDATLFPHKEGIEASWKFVTNILEGWKNQKLKELPIYKPGSWGPEKADELIKKDGRLWKDP